MIITEAQAKEKWCSEARVSITATNAASNRRLGVASYVDIDTSWALATRCLGTGCMHWRWAGHREFPDDDPRNAERRGYCGKSGKPDHG